LICSSVAFSNMLTIIWLAPLGPLPPQKAQAAIL
jgi:hypothetical protein